MTNRSAIRFTFQLLCSTTIKNSIVFLKIMSTVSQGMAMRMNRQGTQLVIKIIFEIVNKVFFLSHKKDHDGTQWSLNGENNIVKSLISTDN